jgi:hypothetical protein
LHRITPELSPDAEFVDCESEEHETGNEQGDAGSEAS